jgi:hypothetical protein
VARLAEAKAVEEDDRLAAFTRNRQRDQHGNAPPVRIARALLQRLFHIALERAAVLLHPQHHLHDQHAGDQHHRGLEIVLRVAGQHLGKADQRRTERERREDAHADTRPQIRQAAPRIVVAVLQPRVQNADDQKRFDALPPHDEQHLTHRTSPAA